LETEKLFQSKKEGQKRGLSVKKAWVVTVDMGYGHQRAAHPLKDIAYQHIITTNSDKLTTDKEKKLWRKTQGFYEAISRTTSWPIIGKFLFSLYDKFQSIAEFYPNRDLSKPSIQSRYFEYLIKKKKLNFGLIEIIKRSRMPLVTTHFIPALAAEYFGLKNAYCVVTDTDINRAWLPMDPKHIHIFYLAPAEHTYKRLKQYGVPDDKLILTGFPLPKENLGGKNLHILKRDLGNRLPNLDPKKKYMHQLKKVLQSKLGHYYKNKSNHKLTLTFLTGGAGAQKEIGIQMLESLKKKILDNEIRVYLTAGTRLEIAESYRSSIMSLGLGSRLGKNLHILFAWDKPSYFNSFNYLLHTTDILWTKPSELVFYTALGLPIIIAPPIGAQEHYNKKWLMELGGGIPQENPRYTREWLFEWLENGRLAEAAFEGFREAPKLGVYNIEKIVLGKKNL